MSTIRGGQTEDVKKMLPQVVLKFDSLHPWSGLQDKDHTSMLSGISVISYKY